MVPVWIRSVVSIAWILAGLLLVLALGGCSGPPLSPSPSPAPVPEVVPEPPPAPLPPVVPRPVLLLGQSNAVNLRDCCLPGLNVVQGGTRLEFWTSGPFAQETREKAAQGLPVVFWQGENNATPDYRAEFTKLVGILREASGNPVLPIRIVQLVLIDATRANHDILMSFDGQPGIKVIKTSDLPPDGVHLMPEAYPIVLERIYRSLM